MRKGLALFLVAGIFWLGRIPLSGAAAFAGESSHATGHTFSSPEANRSIPAGQTTPPIPGSAQAKDSEGPLAPPTLTERSFKSSKEALADRESVPPDKIRVVQGYKIRPKDPKTPNVEYLVMYGVTHTQGRHYFLSRIRKNRSDGKWSVQDPNGNLYARREAPLKMALRGEIAWASGKSLGLVVIDETAKKTREANTTTYEVKYRIGRQKDVLTQDVLVARERGEIHYHLPEREEQKFSLSQGERDLLTSLELVKFDREERHLNNEVVVRLGSGEGLPGDEVLLKHAITPDCAIQKNPQDPVCVGTGVLETLRITFTDRERPAVQHVIDWGESPARHERTLVLKDHDTLVIRMKRPNHRILGVTERRRGPADPIHTFDDEGWLVLERQPDGMVLDLDRQTREVRRTSPKGLRRHGIVGEIYTDFRVVRPEDSWPEGYDQLTLYQKEGQTQGVIGHLSRREYEDDTVEDLLHHHGLRIVSKDGQVVDSFHKGASFKSTFERAKASGADRDVSTLERMVNAVSEIVSASTRQIARAASEVMAQVGRQLEAARQWIKDWFLSAIPG